MKKLIVLSIILLPLMASAQKSIQNFFGEYSELPNYESIEVTEDMFKMFKNIEGADPEMVAFLSKLKFVRYLEYHGSSLSAGTIVTGSENIKNSTSTAYVDGKKVATTVTAVTGSKASTGEGPKNNKKTGKSAGIASTSTTVVTGKASNVASVTTNNNSVLYDRANKEINFNGFIQLMKTNQDGEKMVFLKRDYLPDDKEFIMINGNTMINIRGNINIMHLYQLEEILEGIGEILEFDIPY